MENKRHSWTKEEIDFVKEVYPYYSNAEICKMVFERFGWMPNDRKISNIKSLHKLPNKVISNSGHFEKGHTPWNKGEPMSEETKKKLERTWFKKGEKPIISRPIGFIRNDVNGYTYIKVADPDVWKLYHRLLWEEAHGEQIKENEVIMFADGNKNNFDIDNLVKVSKANMAYLNKNKLIFEDKDLTKAGVAVSKLHEKIYERRKEK